MLSRTLGLTLKEAQSKIDSEEYALWLAAYKIEPWGDFRTELTVANQTLALREIWGDKKSQLSSFLLKFAAEPAQSVREMIAIAKAWASRGEKRAKHPKHRFGHNR